MYHFITLNFLCVPRLHIAPTYREQKCGDHLNHIISTILRVSPTRVIRYATTFNDAFNLYISRALIRGAHCGRAGRDHAVRANTHIKYRLSRQSAASDLVPRGQRQTYLHVSNIQ